MRIPLALLVTVITLQLIVDVYLFCVAWNRTRTWKWPRIQLWSAFAFLLYLVIVLCLPRRTGANADLLTTMWLIYGYMTVYAGKLVGVVVDLIAQLPKICRKKRWRAVSKAGVVLGIAVFMSMWWGALFNRFRTDVKEVTIEVENLPPTFSGYRIVQFSDIHLGTYGNDTTYISHVVDEINSLNPDLILFTGDAVNRIATELQPFITTLSRLHASDGKFSIWGNHDYGGYYDWPTAVERKDNLAKFAGLTHEAGFKLLGDSYAWVKHGSDSIAIIGCHTWSGVGDEKRYRLSLPYPTPHDEVVKIVMTHNPNHWLQSIAEADSANIALTLSGHTHAMQIEIGGISPAVFKYKTWGGLYRNSDGKRPLYVNIGIGCVGLPMRIGATPEITLITLK